MEGEPDATRVSSPGSDAPHSGRANQEAFKQLKVRISKDDPKSPRKPVDASNNSNIGGHGGAAGWFWRNSYSGAPLHGYPESPKLYNNFSGANSTRCPSSPVHVPVTMAYTSSPGYVMFPVMLSGAPDSPRGGLTPLMGSPVSTPTAMMFPQTPFAQHPSAGPFAPPQGPGGPSMRPTSISGAPQVSGGPQGPDGPSAFFHPLFNGFNAFGAPGVGMAPAPHGAFGGPGAPMVPMPPPPGAGGGGKQSRSSNAGDKGRLYQPSPLKPGPRKSSGNGGPPAGVGAFPPMMPLIGRNSNNNSNSAQVVGGPGSSGSSVSPQPPSTASSSARPAGRQLNYQTPAHGGYQPSHGASCGHGAGGVDGTADGAEASPSPHQPASLSPEPSITSYSTSSAARQPAGASNTATSREALDPTTAAAAAAVVAAAAAAVSNMSTGPTPRTSYTGPSVTPPPRTSLSGGLGATASGRTSGSGIALHGAVANTLSAVNVGAHHAALQDDSAAPLHSAGLDADGVGLSSGDVDIPPYGNFVAHGMAHHMGGHAAAAAAAAASAASAWGFYDTTAATGIGGQQVWPAAAMPRLYGAAPHMSGITHLSHPHSHHQVAAMAAAAAQQHVQQPTATMQQPSLLHAAMLQQLAAAANVPAAMQCYVAAPSLDNDYMAAAAAENLHAQLQGLQSLHGAIIASQNLRAAAAAVADMQHQQQHPGVMAAQVAASAAGLGSGGMLMNPAFLSGALGAHHPTHHHHIPGPMHMHGMGMGGGMGPRQRRNHNAGVGTGTASAAASAGADGQVRLNARQRRTLRRAKERAIRGLLEAGKLLVARTMGEGGAEGDEGAASGCDIPSGEYDTDDGDQSDDGESPVRPAGACVSACSATAISGNASSPEVSGVTGVSSAASASAAASGPAAKYAAAPNAASPPATDQAASAGSPHLVSTGDCRSPSSSNASSVCEAGSTGGRAVSNTSSIGGPETLLLGAANSTPSSGKVSPLSAEGSNEPSPAPAPAAPPPRATAIAAVDVRNSPAPSGRSTSAGGVATAVAGAGSAVAAAAALASGAASDLDIAALIQQLNQKREEGLVDEKLLRDLEIINNLIGALKSSVPNTAPSYNAQGRKPSTGHPHGGHGHAHHHGHGNVNAGHAAMHYLNSVQKLPKGFAIGF